MGHRARRPGRRGRPGEAGPVLRFLEQRGLTLRAILLTHHHGDHVGGVMDLTVYGPARERLPRCDVPLTEATG